LTALPPVVIMLVVCRTRLVRRLSMSKRFTVNRAFEIVSALSGDKYALIHFREEHLRSLPDIEEQLRSLDRVFTDSYGSIEYRNLRNMAILACAMRLSAVRMKAKPIVARRSATAANLPPHLHLHHDPDLTPLIVSQFPHAKRDDLHFNRNYHDLVVGDTAVEVGDCRVSKVTQALEAGMSLWVVPEPFDTIYAFSRGRNWRSFEVLGDIMLNALRADLGKADQ